MPNKPVGEDASGEPVHESWTTLAAFASLIPRIRLGHMVSGNTYRHPAVTAKMAAQIDIISGGRFILGLGAAWQENEHHAYGIRFGTLKERMNRFEEACGLITELFRRRRTDVYECAVLAHELPGRRMTLRAVVRLGDCVEESDATRTLLQQFVKDRASAIRANALAFGPPAFVRHGTVIDPRDLTAARSFLRHRPFMSAAHS